MARKGIQNARATKAVRAFCFCIWPKEMKKGAAFFMIFRNMLGCRIL
jgi:hypothetical protein